MASEPSSDGRSRHTLLIESVGIEDFANYSCVAINSMGRHFAVIELRGNPERPVFDSRAEKIDSHRHSGPGATSAWRLSWTTKSYANITEYRLLYRKLPVRSKASAANTVYLRLNEQTFFLNLQQKRSMDDLFVPNICADKYLEEGIEKGVPAIRFLPRLKRRRERD